MSATTIAVHELTRERRTVAACVLGRHEGPECDRLECPLVRVLGRKLRDLRLAGAAQSVDRELDKYRSLARVLGCPVLGQLTTRDLTSSSSTL